MNRRFSIFVVLVLLSMSLQATFGQTAGAIAGTVADSNGAAVPGATVSVRGQSGQEFSAVTSENGAYNIPAVPSGFYTVTITSSGFKTAIFNDVKVDVGLPTTANATLEAGKIEETVVVTGGGEILQTQTATVGTTITGPQITELPLTSRDALDLVTLLPGTAQVGRPRQSTINGLPKGSLSITTDGVDVQDNLLKSSDGFFTFIRPRLDSIEEVTVSTASPGAESGGDGAVQIKFVTRRGTNEYRGGLFWQHRDQSLNSNYWFNNLNGQVRNPIVLNQYGGTFGGPIPIPNFGDGGGPVFKSGKDRAHFFFSREEFRIPESTNRTRTILTPDAAAGLFRYGSNSVNLLTLAATNGFESTIDPTVASLLSAIRSSTGQGTVSPLANPNQQNLNFIAPGGQKRFFTTLRLDFNLTSNHSLENVYNRQIFRNGVDFLNNADPAFPGFPNFGGQDSNRFSNTTALRSTISNNIVNEFRYSVLWGASAFRATLSEEMFANQGGYNLNFHGGALGNANNFNYGSLGITNVTAGLPEAAAGLGYSTAGASNDFRGSPTNDFTNSLTWVHGNHSINIGGQYKRIKLRDSTIPLSIVPIVFFGVDPSDPANSLFTTTNFPGATAAQLNEARAQYALLTGRLWGVQSAAYLQADGTYGELAMQDTAFKQDVYGLYAQDSWKIRPNLTVSFGVRWQPQESIQTVTSNLSYPQTFADLYGESGEGNLFKPGTLTGRTTQFGVVDAGFKPHRADRSNFAPSIGVVYSPDFGDSGWLSTIFGRSGESVFRGGFSRAFVREGTAVAQQVLAGNPGAVLDVSAFVPDGNLSPGTLFRNISSVTLSSFPSTPPDTIVGTTNDAAFAFNPKIKTGHVDSWSVGYQRQLGQDFAVEIRYVGNRGKNLWRMFNLNEVNILENGFRNEFILAQQNLIANNAAGGSRAGSFAYFGPGTGTAPLPFIFGYFRGAGNPNDPGLYTSANYRIGTFLTPLNPLNANPIGFATNLQNSAARRANALAAGLPSNFFRVNPTVLGGAFLVDNAAETSYDALVIEVRRRLARGLLVQGSYAFGKSLSDFFGSSAITNVNFRSLHDRDLNRTYSPFDVRHVFKANWLYELPFGNGGLFFKNAKGWVNALVGGFTINGALKVQSGVPIQFGNVNLVGMTRSDLEEAIAVYNNVPLRYGANAPIVAAATFLPADIVQNSHLANNLLPFTGRAIVPAGYGNCVARYTGDCGFSNLVVHGPDFWRLDLSLGKKIRFGENRNVEIRAAMYNALNNPQWRVGGWAADVVTVGTGIVGGLTTTTFGQLTNGSVYQDTSTTNDQGGRTVELVLRINF
jgi:hypothetical protein